MIEILERSIFCLMMDDGSIYSNLIRIFLQEPVIIINFFLFYFIQTANEIIIVMIKMHILLKNLLIILLYINWRNWRIFYLYILLIYFIYIILYYIILYFIIYFWVFKDTDLIDIFNKKNYFAYKFISYIISPWHEKYFIILS